MLSLFLSLAACDSGEAVDPCTDCHLVDANNYSYTSTLSIGQFPLPEHTDAFVDWSALTVDIRGGALDPMADLTDARLVAFRDLPPDEVAWALSHDELAQADVGAYVTCTPTDASCLLSEFGMFGNQLDIQQYFQEGFGSWLVVLGKPGSLGADALAFLVPTEGATASSADLTDATSSLQADVDLASAEPLVVPPVVTDISLDWGGLTRDGLGDPLDFATVDELWIGRFEESVGTLESDIFALEDLADATWTADVSGVTSVSLEALQGELPFRGVDSQGTWVLALRCNTCTNPAPRLLTLLQAE